MRCLIAVVSCSLLSISGCGNQPAAPAPTAEQIVGSAPTMPGPPKMPGPPVPANAESRSTRLPGPPAPAAPTSAAPTETPPPTAPPADTPPQDDKLVLNTLLAQKQQASGEQMKKIGLAMHNFLDKHDTFPPAFVADSAGKPLYSWRVLRLPFLGQQALYDAFDKTKAWDAPGNLEISNTAVDIFKSPADSSVAANGVNYVAVVGDGMAFQGTKGTTTRDFLDGLKNSIAVVEVRGVAGSWAAPVDFQAKALKWKLGTGAGEFNSPYPQALFVLMCDTNVRFVHEVNMPTVFPAAFGINDRIDIGTY